VSKPVYTQRFIAEQGLSSTVDWPVPSGFRAVIRDVSGNFGASSPGFEIRCFIANGAAVCFFAYDAGLGLDQPFHWEGRVVAEAGELVRAQVITGNADVVISGYLLTLP
jgi:hypothetical protein